MVVASADQLAVEGTRRGGTAGAELLERAALLRERLFRLEHREVDALEAIELLSAAERAGATCAGLVHKALLAAELRAEPSAAYAAIHPLARRADSPCRTAALRALVGLAGFEPPASVLEASDPRSQDGGLAGASPSAPASSLVVMPATVPDPKAERRVTRIERYGADDAARVVVHVTEPVRFELASLPAAPGAPPRVVLDLPGVRYDGERRLSVGGLVQAVRVGQQKQGTRIVLDLSRDAQRRAFYLPEPFRLVIDVSKDGGAADGVGGARRVKRLVLDPGHGGHDPGATGPSGLREKDVTLDVAHRAAPLLARELGVVTLLTRDSDAFVPLDERAARANAFGADLLVSIHCNASDDGTGHGVSTFVLDDSRDALASRIAARENAASVAAAVELANTLGSVMDPGTRERSLHFAGLLQRASMASLATRYPGVNDLGVRRGGFYVLAGARMPAVLYETSFISSELEETRLNTADYRQKLADAIVNAVRAYRDGH